MDPSQLANINNLEEYIELLYEEVVGQVITPKLPILAMQMTPILGHY